MNEIFVDKNAFHKALHELSNNYDTDFVNSASIKTVNDKMQKTLLRPAGHERSDIMNNKKYPINVDKIFNPKHNPGIDHTITKKQNPVILGATYNTMDKIINGSKNYIGKKNIIILTGDRPFYPEDFKNNEEKLIHTSLFSFDKRYKSHSKEISIIVNKYKNSKENPLLKKVRFIVDLVTLLDKNNGKYGSEILNNLTDAIEKRDAQKIKQNTIEIRKFVYEIGIKYVPTETTLARTLCNKHLLKCNILETKASYKIQDRATTIDTYHTLIEYAKNRNIPIEKFILIGIKPFIYRQWLQFAFEAKNENIDYIATENIVSTSLFADEFARLVHVIALNDEKMG